jgi:hypothetical protein
MAGRTTATKPDVFDTNQDRISPLLRTDGWLVYMFPNDQVLPSQPRPRDPASTAPRAPYPYVPYDCLTDPTTAREKTHGVSTRGLEMSLRQKITLCPFEKS